MLHRVLADLVLLLHLGFVAFVVLGGLLVLRWPRAAWLHLPAVLWGATVELTGWICPLTPLENALRRAGGEAAYSTGFVEHYVTPLLYPATLTRQDQLVYGVAVLVVNAAVYAGVLWRARWATARTRP